MSSQAGALYFDNRDINETEASAILRGVACIGCNPPASYKAEGAFLAHADVPLDPYRPDGGQPHTAGTNTITFDGRLDNRDDLLLRLHEALRGNTSDAGLALAVYSRWGVEGLVNLLGDWSLVIWNAAEKAV